MVGVSFSNSGIKMSKRITVNSQVNEVHEVPTDKDIIETEKSKGFQLEKEKHPEFWKEFNCVILSRVDTHPSLVQNKTTSRYGLGYPTSGHVCYAINSYWAHCIWVMHCSHSYENCLICPICDKVNPFD